MNNYQRRFEQMVEALQSDSRIEVTEVEFGAPASEAELQAAAKAAGGRLPEGMADFYRELGSFKLSWAAPELDSGSGRARGLINLLPIYGAAESVFEDWEGVIWFDDSQRLKQIKPLDFFIDEACAALYPVPGKAPLIHYHYLGEELHPTGYGFSDYIELLLRSRGFWYWPKALCVECQDSQAVENFRATMPRLFSDYDDGLFVPRTDEGELELD